MGGRGSGSGRGGLPRSGVGGPRWRVPGLGRAPASNRPAAGDQRGNQSGRAPTGQAGGAGRDAAGSSRAQQQRSPGREAGPQTRPQAGGGGTPASTATGWQPQQTSEIGSFRGISPVPPIPPVAPSPSPAGPDAGVPINPRDAADAGVPAPRPDSGGHPHIPAGRSQKTDQQAAASADGRDDSAGRHESSDQQPGDTNPVDGPAQADVPPIQGGDDAGAPYPTGGPNELATAEQVEPPAGVTGTIAGPSGDGDGYVPPGAPLDAGGSDLGVVLFDGADYVTQQSDGSWVAGHLDSTDLVAGVPGGWTAGAEGGYLPAGSGFGATADPDHGGDAGANGTDPGTVQFNGAGYIAPNGDGSGSVGHIDGATFVTEHPGEWSAPPPDFAPH